MWKRKLNLCSSQSLSALLFFPRRSNHALFNPLSQLSLEPSSSSSISREPFSSIFVKTHPHFLQQHPLLSGKFFFCSDAVADESRCWNCDAVASSATPFLYCQACKAIQPIDHSIDYFRIFGLGKKYDIKGVDLETMYKSWQRKLHPDLVHSKTQKERDYAAEQSARVTEAYRTLTNPLSRAIYILKLEGVDVDEEERITDPELLVEVMEIREAVEDSADTKVLNEIHTQIQEKFEHWSKAFADAFQSRKFEYALASIRRMTYYKRASEEIIKKL